MTPLYSSPEQLGMFDGNVDLRSDLYSLTLVYSEMLAGRRLERTEKITDLREDVPKKIDSVINKGLSHKPEKRYSDSGEMKNALERLLDVYDLAKTTFNFGKLIFRLTGFGAIMCVSALAGRTCFKSPEVVMKDVVEKKIVICDDEIKKIIAERDKLKVSLADARKNYNEADKYCDKIESNIEKLRNEKSGLEKELKSIKIEEEKIKLETEKAKQKNLEFEVKRLNIKKSLKDSDKKREDMWHALKKYSSKIAYVKNREICLVNPDLSELIRFYECRGDKDFITHLLWNKDSTVLYWIRAWYTEKGEEKVEEVSLESRTLDKSCLSHHIKFNEQLEKLWPDNSIIDIGLDSEGHFYFKTIRRKIWYKYNFKTAGLTEIGKEKPKLLDQTKSFDSRYEIFLSPSPVNKTKLFENSSAYIKSKSDNFNLFWMKYIDRVKPKWQPKQQ